jgi:hypothetical protein
MTIIQLNPLEIIYNKNHPTIKLQLKEKSVQIMRAYIVQEITGNIIYRRMNTTANQNRMKTTARRQPTLDESHQNSIHAHLLVQC